MTCLTKWIKLNYTCKSKLLTIIWLNERMPSPSQSNITCSKDKIGNTLSRNSQVFIYTSVISVGLKVKEALWSYMRRNAWGLAVTLSTSFNKRIFSLNKKIGLHVLRSSMRWKDGDKSLTRRFKSNQSLINHLFCVLILIRMQWMVVN